MSGVIIASIAIPIAIVVVVLFSLRSSGAFGMTKAKREMAQQLIATGEKARATIMAVRPTGMVVNEINVQCVIAFQIQPLRGGPPFYGEKKSLISQVAMPRLGDVWPCWFDPSDPSKFAVGQPTEITPQQVALYQEFGIPHPFAQQFGQQPGLGPQPWSMQKPQPGPPQPPPGYPQY